MPEEIEVETSDLQETIDELREQREEREREARETKWTRFISLTTALFAVVAAIAALRAGALANEAVITKSEAVLKQSTASDTWAYYQAKGIKAETDTVAADQFATAGNKAKSAYWRLKADREKAGQAKLKSDAAALEAKRDEDGEEAEALLQRHEVFAWCVTCMQVAISLSAIAALTKRKDVWLVSIVLGVAGTGLFIYGFAFHPSGAHPAAAEAPSVSSESAPEHKAPAGQKGPE